MSGASRLQLGLMVLVALASGACSGTFPNIMSVDPNHLRHDQAVVVLSATSQDSCTVTSTELTIQRTSSASPERLAMMQGQNPSGPSDFTDVHGRVYTLALAPGRYDFRLRSLNPEVRFVNGSSNSMVTRPVTVEGGTVTYIGEFRDVGCNLKRMDIRDSSVRDLQRVRLYKPSLDVSRVRIEIAEVLDN